MLELLQLQNVGPAPTMTMELAPRVNLITGDNGLGKSFLLDIAFWALTRKWPAEINPKLGSGAMARPRTADKASIAFRFEGYTKPARYAAEFDRKQQAWRGKPGRPSNPGLVLYAHADGGFSVWDPSRNYWWQEGTTDVQILPPAFVFTANEVWEGLRVGETTVCTGLLFDWILWQGLGGEPFSILERVLEALSPPGGPLLAPGPFVRVGLDAREYPSLTMPDGVHVPLIHASAGVRRVVALAYLLVWAWREHEMASEQVGKPVAKQIIFLIDEPEAHLHPRWQRTILRALERVVGALTANASVATQIVAATHSPLVLASAEPFFDPDRDAWFDLDLEGKEVVLRKRPFVPLGEVGNWLTSDAFDLDEPRSLEGEDAVRAAQAVLDKRNPKPSEIKAADEKLRSAGLPDIDPFWVRWGYFRDRAAKQQAPLKVREQVTKRKR